LLAGRLSPDGRAGVLTAIRPDQDWVDGLLLAVYSTVSVFFSRKPSDVRDAGDHVPWKTVMKLKYWLDVLSIL
jgi:hypothetical protein